MMDWSRFKNYLIPVVLTGLIGSCGESESLSRREFSGGALGTSYSIITYSTQARDFSGEIDSVFAVFNRSMSTYISDSDISRINSGDSTIRVDAMFREVFLTAQQVWESSAGYFDPTVGILVDAWGFGPGVAISMDSSAVDSLLRYVGLEKVQLLPDNRIKKQYPEIRLDFNAIAKGYAIDRLAELLESYGTEHYLIEVGGELRTRGINPDKNQPWNVGIDDPRVTDGRAIMRVISLSNLSMASSGNYRKFRVDSETGEKFVHTIDPHSGFTRTSNVLAASVIAPSCMLADAYATTLMAMPLEDSKELLQVHPELEGYLVYLDEIGNIQEYMTSGFEKLLH